MEARKHINIYTFTWNLCGEAPLFQDLFNALGPPQYHDLYVIGSQECMRTIAKSLVDDSKHKWEAIITYITKQPILRRPIC